MMGDVMPATRLGTPDVGDQLDAQKEAELKQGYTEVSKATQDQALKTELQRIQGKIDSKEGWATTVDFQRPSGEKIATCNVRVIKKMKGETPVYTWLKTPDVLSYAPAKEYASHYVDPQREPGDSADEAAIVAKLVKAAKGVMSGDPRTGSVARKDLVDQKIITQAEADKMPKGNTMALVEDNNDKDANKKPKIKLFFGDEVKA